MKKQEIIQQSYGEHWDKVKYQVDENGWCTMFDENNTQVTPSFSDLGFSLVYAEGYLDSGYNSKKKTFEWRPKSLHGIESNNGWIKIESEADLPKEEGEFWVFFKESDVMHSYYLLDKGFTWDGHEVYRKNATHYQPIIKPELPIY